MDLQTIKVDKIYVDHEFNCRGEINALDVGDLVTSIKAEGLLQPIVVMPFNEKGFDYKVNAGFRRLQACKVLGWTDIPAVVKAEMSYTAAKILNLSENLNRQDLNKLQEAKALEDLYNHGLSEPAIAEAVGKSRGWVQIRLIILKLETPIQDEIKKGVLTDMQIRQLYKLESSEERYAYVKHIKDNKLRGEKPTADISKVVNQKNRRAARTQSEMLEMVELVVDTVGASFATKLLAWAAGNHDDYSIHYEIQQEAKLINKHYEIPRSIINSKLKAL